MSKQLNFDKVEPGRSGFSKDRRTVGLRDVTPLENELSLFEYRIKDESPPVNEKREFISPELDSATELRIVAENVRKEIEEFCPETSEENESSDESN